MNTTLPSSCLLRRFAKTALLFCAVFITLSCPVKAQTVISVGTQTATFSGAVRGYYFTAPVGFTICGLYIPTDASTDPQSVEVVRFTNGAPPEFSTGTTTNTFTSLFYQANYVPNTTIPCNIVVNAGDIIGVYGARGSSQVNSYGTPSYVTNILGNSVTLTRSGMQFSLATAQMHDIWKEAAFQIARIQMTINCCNAVTPTVTSPVTYCQYDAAQPLTATGNSLQWYTSPTGGTASTTAPAPNTLTPGTTTYYVSGLGTSPAGCESPRTPLQVVVNPKPVIPVGDTLLNFCQNDPVVPLVVNGQNLKWYATANGGTGSTNMPPYTTNTPGSIVYYVSQTVNGCESDRLRIRINVGVKPPPPVVQTPVMYCTNDVASALTAAGQYALRWYTTPTGGAPMPATPVPSTAAEDTLTYWVAQSDNGCESFRTKLDVIVHTRPNGIILASRATICQYDTVSFKYFGNALVSDQYNWTISWPAGSLVSGTGQGPLVVRYDSVGSYPVRLLVNHQGCYSKEAVYNVQVNAAPELRTTMKPTACADEPVLVGLNYATPGIDNYVWNFDGGKEQYGTSGGGPFGIKWSTPGLKQVSVIAAAKGCPSLRYLDTIRIYPRPYAHIDAISSTNICANDTLRLIGNLTDSGSTYQWSPANAYMGTLADTQRFVYASIPFTSYLSLQVTDTNGCKSADSVRVEARPCCELYLPDAFTPNGDGLNDVFKIITDGNHKITTFRILNRWGQVVFETADESKGWDGTWGGVAQSIGTYYYYLKYRCVNGSDIETKGEITLVR